MAYTDANYPDTFDDDAGVFPVINPTDTLNTPGKIHSFLHTRAGDAIEAIQRELGLNPSDGVGLTFDSVKLRLNDMEARLGDAPLFVGTTAPDNPVNGMVWLDTSNLA